MTRSSRRRLWLVVFGAVAVIGAAAITITVTAARSHHGVNAASTSADPDPTGDAARPLQLDPGDAVAAAVRYVASTGELFAHSPVGRREILRRLVTPDALEDQAAALDDTAAAMSKKLAHPIEEYVWVEAPLTAGLDKVDGPDGDVTVSVWTVAVFADPAGELVEQVWRTVHVTLAAVDGRWLIASAWTDAGPTPTANDLAWPSPVEDYLTVARLAPVVAHEGL